MFKSTVEMYSKLYVLLWSVQLIVYGWRSTTKVMCFDHHSYQNFLETHYDSCTLYVAMWSIEILSNAAKLVSLSARSATYVKNITRNTIWNGALKHSLRSMCTFNVCDAGSKVKITIVKFLWTDIYFFIYLAQQAHSGHWRTHLWMTWGFCMRLQFVP